MVAAERYRAVAKKARERADQMESVGKALRQTSNSVGLAPSCQGLGWR